MRATRQMSLCLPLFFLFFATVFLPSGSCYADPAVLVNEGVSHLFIDKDVQLAHAKFSQALGEAPNHQAANFFYAFSRITILSNNQDFNSLLDGFGITADGRNPLSWTADITRNENGNKILPEDTPPPNEIRDVLNSILLPEIQGALVNLGKLDNTFNLVLLMSDTGADTVIELDYGDAALFRSGLYGISALIKILNSHEYTLDIGDLNHEITTLENYPDFIKLLATHNLPAAKDDLKNGVDAYFAASTFIRNELDDQYDDFVSFDYESLPSERESRIMLADIKESLDGAEYVDYDDENNQLYLDLSNFFAGSIDLSSYLPDFKANFPIACTMPAPTIGGTLPDFTQENWNKVLPMVVPVSGVVSCPAWTGGSIYIMAFEDPFPYNDNLVASTNLNAPGPYTIYVPNGKTEYIRGLWDKNEDGIFGPGDYGNAANANMGTQIDGCDITGVDFSLEELLGIQGRVTMNGQPIGNAWIGAYSSASWGFMQDAMTDENGYYSLIGLEPQAPVYVLAYNPQNYMSLWWNGSSSGTSHGNQALAVTSSAGSTVVNFDFGGSSVDQDADGDVDGLDLAKFAIKLQAGSNEISIQEFASAYGQIN